MAAKWQSAARAHVPDWDWVFLSGRYFSEINNLSAMPLNGSWANLAMVETVLR
jgi:hypothetical protein